MYSIHIIKSSINLYFKLENINIIGKERSNIITSVFKIHINTLYNWIKTYYNKTSKTFDFTKYKSNFKYNNLKLTSKIEAYIINSIDKNNNFNVKNIRKNIYNAFNLSLSKSTIYFVLHKHNLTYKKLIVKNVPYTNDKLDQLKSNLKNLVSNLDQNNIVSYDEMAIYLNAKPYRGWSKKGTNCIIQTKNKSITNKRYTIGMGINKKGYIDFTFVLGPLNGDKFNTFMKKLNKNNNTIFMDNASIHKNKNFNKYLQHSNLNVIYNIPYHSELNPIEYIFSLLRIQLLSSDNFTEKNIINIILDFKKNINKNSIINIFNNCFDKIKNF